MRLPLRANSARNSAATVDLLDRLVQVQNVNLVPAFEDEGLHFRVPTLGLVTEVDAGFDEFYE